MIARIVIIVSFIVTVNALYKYDHEYFEIVTENLAQHCPDSLKCLIPTQCNMSVDHTSDISYPCGDGLLCCHQKTTDSRISEILPASANTNSNTIVTLMNKQSLHSDMSPEHCGQITSSDRIVNGKNASIGQFPWMALLGYRLSSAANFLQFLCGGTLINNRYVLTAAHCTARKDLNLTVVRLGELNLLTQRDCEFDDCADEYIDVPVELVIPHESYNATHFINDIALIKLSRDVNFTDCGNQTYLYSKPPPKQWSQWSELRPLHLIIGGGYYIDFIRPICLYNDLRVEPRLLYAGKNFVISGWGKTSAQNVAGSSILQFGNTKVWTDKSCNNILPESMRPLNTSVQMCASGPKGEDSCQGDSGGPLTNYTNAVAYQVGIVSFGISQSCGLSELPTVYTKVEYYLHWIRDKVKL